MKFQQVCVQPHTSAVNMTLPAIAAEHHAAARAAAPLLLGAQHLQLSIDISCLHGTQQQTHHMLLLWSTDGTGRWMDGRTDGWMDIRPFH